jgi:hypothetical protein
MKNDSGHRKLAGNDVQSLPNVPSLTRNIRNRIPSPETGYTCHHLIVSSLVGEAVLRSCATAPKDLCVCVC